MRLPELSLHFLKLFLLSVSLYYGNFVMKMFLLLFDLLKETVRFHLLLKHSVRFVRCLWHLHFSPHVFSFCLSSGRASFHGHSHWTGVTHSTAEENIVRLGNVSFELGR